MSVFGQLKNIMLNVFTEYEQLKKVLMASVSTFQLHKPINRTQEYYYKIAPPDKSILLEEQEQFFDVLRDNGVDIILATPRNDCTNQLNTRDVAFVVGNSFVVSPMKEPIRQQEHLALDPVISSLESTDKIFRPNSGVIEGGDIILDSNRIYVGISQRTNKIGYNWLVEKYSNEFEIVPIFLEEGFLHLDVVFNLISPKHALIYEKGIMASSLELLVSRYCVISTPEQEQINLPTNVFSINPEIVVADKRNKITNKYLCELGKKVIEIDFSEISKIGGSFRCSTCPLVRG